MLQLLCCVVLVLYLSSQARKSRTPAPPREKRRLFCVFSRHDVPPRHGWVWGRRIGASELGALLTTYQPVRLLRLQRGSLTSIYFYERRASCAGGCPTILRRKNGALLRLALHVHTSWSCISWPGARDLAYNLHSYSPSCRSNDFAAGG